MRIIPSSEISPSLSTAHGGSIERARRIAVDIDDTLSRTAIRWAEILMLAFPLPEHSIDGLIAEFRRASSVPDWQHEEAQKLIHELRVSEEVHLSYQTVEGAVGGVHAVRTLLEVEYLTMRPRTVHQATERWLERFAFPNGEVVACPDEIPYEERPAWKAAYLANQYPTTIGIIEDDPRVALALPSHYAGTVFLYSHEAAPRDDIHIEPCPDWESVQHAVARHVERTRTIDLSL